MSLGNLIDPDGTRISMSKLLAATKLLRSDTIEITPTNSMVTIQGTDVANNKTICRIEATPPKNVFGRTWNMPRVPILNACELFENNVLDQKDIEGERMKNCSDDMCSDDDCSDDMWMFLPIAHMTFYENGISFLIWFDEYSDNEIEIEMKSTTTGN